MDKKPGAAIAGFLFWFLMAGLIYTHNYWWSLILGLGSLMAALAWGGLRWIWMCRPPRPEPPPKSDLPVIDFKDVKPGDFE